MTIQDYGFTSDLIKDIDITSTSESTSAPTLLIPARVTAVHKQRYDLFSDAGTTTGRLKTTEYYNGSELFPATGDFVLVEYNPNGESRIIKTLARHSYFSRLDPSSSGHYEQAIAANFDYVFIMQSLNYDFNIHRLERYLTLAWQSGALPVIILSKADLIDDYSRQLEEARDTAIGADVYPISVKTNFGIDTLEKYLTPGKTAVFLGSSGVGKSSLVNKLAGEDIMTVNGIREDDSKGRHTTTCRQLVMLSSGVMIIDTPGMRELGMWDISEGLGQSFIDVERYFGQCKFNDCKHNGEPGCAVAAAIESGELSRERWESYYSLKYEAKYSDDKAAYLREKQRWHKNIAINNKNMKKNGYIKK